MWAQEVPAVWHVLAPTLALTEQILDRCGANAEALRQFRDGGAAAVGVDQVGDVGLGQPA